MLHKWHLWKEEQGFNYMIVDIILNFDTSALIKCEVEKWQIEGAEKASILQLDWVIQIKLDFWVDPLSQ